MIFNILNYVTHLSLLPYVENYIATITKYNVTFECNDWNNEKVIYCIPVLYLLLQNVNYYKLNLTLSKILIKYLSMA